MSTEIAGKGLLAVPLADPDDAPARMVGDQGQVAVAAPVADLVDPDPLQPRRQPRTQLGDNACDDAGDAAPGDPEQPADHAEGGLLGEPADQILEGAREAGPVPRPGHRLADHPPATRAEETAQRVLEKPARAAEIEMPPTPQPPVIADRAQTATSRANKPPAPQAQHAHNPLALEGDRRDAHARDPQQPIECRSDAHLRLLVTRGLDTATVRAARCASHRPVPAHTKGRSPV